MINGSKILKEKYNYLNLNKNQIQPSGIDLCLNKLSALSHDKKIVYGLFEDVKKLPQQKELKTTNVQVDGSIREVYVLSPHVPYIATTKEKIKITNNAGQIYFPRSSLLRAGIDVRTAYGDSGFFGHLNFLLINHTDELFMIEKGARFAQLIDISTSNVEEGYDGDYQEV